MLGRLPMEEQPPVGRLVELSNPPPVLEHTPVVGQRPEERPPPIEGQPARSFRPRN